MSWKIKTLLTFLYLMVLSSLCYISIFKASHHMLEKMLIIFAIIIFYLVCKNIWFKKENLHKNNTTKENVKEEYESIIADAALSETMEKW